MIKKGKKAVLLTTMLSVISTSAPAIPVYAEDSTGNGDPPASDQGEEVLAFASQSDSQSLSKPTTNTERDNWHNPDESSVPGDSDGSKEGDSSPPVKLTKDDSSGEESPTENNVPAPEDTNGEGNSFSENPDDNDSSNPPDLNGMGNTLEADRPTENSSSDTQEPNADAALMYRNLYTNNSVHPEAPKSNDSLISESPDVNDSPSPGDADGGIPLIDNADSTPTLPETIESLGCLTLENGILTIENRNALEYDDDDDEFVWVSQIKSSIESSLKNDNPDTYNENYKWDEFWDNFEWDEFWDDIHEINILDNAGVEEILENTFSRLSNLKRVTIPGSVKIIEQNAFSFSDEDITSGGVTFKGAKAPEMKYIPFGQDNLLLPVYVPFDSKEYDSQIAGWYTFWYLPKVENCLLTLKIVNDYPDVSYINDPSYTTLPRRKITYTYTLQYKTPTGDWENDVNITDIPLNYKWGGVNLQAPSGNGWYRYVVNAACFGKDNKSEYHGQVYHLISNEFEWKASINNNNSGFDYSQKEEEPEKKDDEPDSGQPDDKNNLDSNQNAEDPIGFVSISSSQMQGVWNNDIFGSEIVPTVNNKSQDHDSNSSGSFSKNKEDDTLSKKADKKKNASDPVDLAAKSIGLFNGQKNIILVSFISVLFIARILMLFIKKRKTDLI